MRNLPPTIKIWAKLGTIASLLVHFSRADGLFGSRVGQVWEVPVTPFLILIVLFWRASSFRVLTALTIGFVILLPDFRLSRERAIQSEIRALPVNAKEALPRLTTALDRYPGNPELTLILAELQIAEGRNRESFQSLQNVPVWPDELLPRVQHLRYALARGGLTSGRIPEIIAIP